VIVEDDTLIQLDLEHALHDGCYATITEVSGEAAMAKLETVPKVRALITDIT
jgi:CheY-like chemotaxis protein